MVGNVAVAAAAATRIYARECTGWTWAKLRGTPRRRGSRGVCVSLRRK